MNSSSAITSQHHLFLIICILLIHQMQHNAPPCLLGMIITLIDNPQIDATAVLKLGSYHHVLHSVKHSSTNQTRLFIIYEELVAPQP